MKPVDLQRAGRIYKKLLRIAPDLVAIREYSRSRVPGYMDLSCDILEAGREFRRIALSHYWKHPSGDMIPDPDMEISVFLDWELAEAMTYQDAFTYEAAYADPGEPPDLTIHARINEFLEQWLDNLAMQGHQLKA